MSEPQPQPSRPTAPFDLAGLRVEPGLDTVVGSSGAIHLEPKVMEVLLLLARRQGETVSAQELIDEVWKGREVVDAVVTRAISELRRALGDDPKAPRFIQTVARRGYRLIAPITPAAAPARGRRPWRGYGLGALALLAASLAVGLALRRPAAAELPPQAYRLFTEARQALDGGSCVAEEALGSLEKVLALAPTHAPAWEAYGWAHYNRVSSCGESGAAYVEATKAAERALELDLRLAGALALQAAVLTETGRAERALELLAPRQEGSAELAALAGYAATYVGDLDEAARLAERAVALDATFYEREGWTPNALLYLGRERRFLEIAARGTSPLARFYRGFAHYRLGESERARAELEPAFVDRPSDPFARLAEALVAILDGRPEEARLLVGQLALQRERLAASDGELTFRLAELTAAAGEPERALALLERAVDQGFVCSRCLASAPTLRPLLARPAGAPLLARAQARERALGAASGKLLVFAAASLTDALREIGRGYEAGGGQPVAFHFAASSLLARQIEEGAPADAFFAADEATMDGLARRGLLVPGSRRDLLGNRLVVVVPSDSPLALAKLDDLASTSIRALALAEPRTVPAGVYAKQLLEQKGLWSRLVDRVVPTENVRAALAAVEGGNVDAGIVYATDAVISTRVRVALEIPAAEGPKIRYPVAAVAASARGDEARRFLAHLASEPALAVFRRYGFEVLAAAP